MVANEPNVVAPVSAKPSSGWKDCTKQIGFQNRDNAEVYVLCLRLYRELHKDGYNVRWLVGRMQ